MIKVCKKKTYDNLSLCGKILSKIIRIGLLVCIPLGVIDVVYELGFAPLSWLVIMLGIMVEFLIIPINRNLDDEIGYNNIFTDFNKKYKLFGWNEDC